MLPLTGLAAGGHHHSHCHDDYVCDNHDGHHHSHYNDYFWHCCDNHDQEFEVKSSGVQIIMMMTDKRFFLRASPMHQSFPQSLGKIGTVG